MNKLGNLYFFIRFLLECDNNPILSKSVGNKDHAGQYEDRDKHHKIGIQ